MKSYLSYRERVAGFFVLFAFIGVVFFIVGAAVQNRWLEPRVNFRTLVLRGDALRPGAPVLLSGLEIGEIGSLTILKDNRIEVVMEIREQYAGRVKQDTRAEIRRVVGLGEKQILLVSEGDGGESLPAGAIIPAIEPLDIVDAISTVDLGRYLATLDRLVEAMEVALKKLDEKERLERIMETFDQMGPTLVQLNQLLEDLHEPLVSLVGNSDFKRTFEGAAKVFNDRNTRRAMSAISKTFEKERMDELITSMVSTFDRVGEATRPDGEFNGAMKGANRLLNDKRFDSLLSATSQLADAKKLSKLVDDMGIVANQLAKMGPKIPTLTEEMIETMREAVVVLKALQKTWLLEEESKAVRKQRKQ